MHPYSIDSGERKKIYGILGIISVLVSWAIIHYLPLNLSFPWFISAPTTPFAVYLLLYSFFNRWGWKWKIIRSVTPTRVPNLEGKWTGYIKSSFDEHDTKSGIELEIKQRWTNMELKMETDTSSSYSYAASIRTDEFQDTFLNYTYQNKPEPDANADMEKHEGTAVLTFKDGSKPSLDGYYFTGRGRGTYGKICLEKEDGKADSV